MKIYSIETLSELLGIHPETARKKAKAKEITGYKEGIQWRFTEEDVKAYIEKKKEEMKK